jgi:hypothetical protein
MDSYHEVGIGPGDKTADKMINALIINFDNQGVHLRKLGGAEGTRTPDPHTARAGLGLPPDLATRLPRGMRPLTPLATVVPR